MNFLRSHLNELLLTNNMYFPEEDSYLLEKVVKDVVEPGMIVCDMGTGSGIQAFAAADSGARIVLAVDIDTEALDHIMRLIQERKYPTIRTRHSDLFCEFSDNELFDLIIFNAPYLPDEKKDPDVALDGGKEGHELITRFLEQAKNYLQEKGSILLLFSTKTGLANAMQSISENGFLAEEKAYEGMFFEGLYVYQLRLNENSPECEYD